MSFTFEARTLLELGKELISTDEVALYELIKNAVDAKSDRVEILVTVRLVHSEYVEARARLIEEGHSMTAVREFVARSLLEPEHPESRRLLDALPTDGDEDEFLEALEEAYRAANTIEVRDTGEGMSLADLSDVFMRIGTRSRRTENLQGARNLGDKGIGRLSAMRLGDRLQVKTTRAGEPRWNLLDIDWSRFTHDTRASVEDIEIEPYLGEEKHDPGASGTSILVSGLQADWDFVRFTDILQGRIARMIDPFEPGLANRLLVPRHNGVRVQVPSIPRGLLDAAHAVCHVDFTMVNGEPRLTGFVSYGFRHRRIEIDQRGAEVYALKSALETAADAYEHVTNVWAIVESHRIAMPGGRTGYPHLHVFRSLSCQADLEIMAGMLEGWAETFGARMERIRHRGDWNAMAPIYEGRTPTLSPF